MTNESRMAWQDYVKRTIKGLDDVAVGLTPTETRVLDKCVTDISKVVGENGKIASREILVKAMSYLNDGFKEEIVLTALHGPCPPIHELFGGGLFGGRGALDALGLDEFIDDGGDSVKKVM